MKNKLLFLTYTFLLLPSLSLAQPAPTLPGGTSRGGLENAAQGTGLIQTDFPHAVAIIINIVLSILGILFVILMVLGGFKWMTSSGNSERVKEAKELIRNGLIGVIIILTSYAIARFVFDSLAQVQTGCTPGSPGCP